jgi:hypothetical protein
MTESVVGKTIPSRNDTILFLHFFLLKIFLLTTSWILSVIIILSAKKSLTMTVSIFVGSNFGLCSSIHWFGFGCVTTKKMSRPSIVRSPTESPNLKIFKEINIKPQLFISFTIYDWVASKSKMDFFENPNWKFLRIA